MPSKMTSLLLLFAIFFRIITMACADNECDILKKICKDYPDWKPRGIIDVGANIGGWTTRVQEFLPGVPTLMVEASTTHNKELEETKQKFPDAVDYQIAVLSSSDGNTVEFFSVEGMGTGNSMFKEQTHYFKGVKPDQRTTSKLDTLLGNSHLDNVDYLKIDVQGAELMVLSGATETLKKVTFVQLEVSVIEYNKGGACWHEIDDLLRQNGFYFYDSLHYNRNVNLFHTKGIGQFEVLYAKPSSAYMPKWLVENKVRFCGSGRNTATARVQNSVREETTMAKKSVVLDADASTTTKKGDWMFLYFFVGTAFVLGYGIGLRCNKDKGLLKTT